MKWRLEKSSEPSSFPLTVLPLSLVPARGLCLSCGFLSADPVSLVRDHRVNEALSERGILVRSFNGDLLHEPWEMAACTGGAGAGAGAGAVAGSGTRAVAGAVGSELQKGTGDRLAGGAGADAGTGAGVGALTGAGAQQAMTLKASQKTVANTSSAVDKGLTFDNFFQQWLLQTPRPPLAAPTSLVVPPAGKDSLLVLPPQLVGIQPSPVQAPDSHAAALHKHACLHSTPSCCWL